MIRYISSYNLNFAPVILDQKRFILGDYQEPLKLLFCVDMFRIINIERCREFFCEGNRRCLIIGSSQNAILNKSTWTEITWIVSFLFEGF